MALLCVSCGVQGGVGCGVSDRSRVRVGMWVRPQITSP